MLPASFPSGVIPTARDDETISRGGAEGTLISTTRSGSAAAVVVVVVVVGQGRRTAPLPPSCPAALSGPSTHSTSRPPSTAEEEEGRGRGPLSGAADGRRFSRLVRIGEEERRRGGTAFSSLFSIARDASEGGGEAEGGSVHEV